MRLSINIEYEAKADRDGETAEDEERVMDVVQEELESYVASIRRRCEANGLQVTIST